MYKPFKIEHFEYVQTYVWYDGPMIFLVKDIRDNSYYLVNLYDRTDEYDEWLLFLLNEDNKTKLENDLLLIQDHLIDQNNVLLLKSYYDQNKEDILTETTIDVSLFTVSSDNES